MTGGGLWQPEAESLRKLRREFDRRSNRIKDILKEERIRKNFLGGVSTDDAKVVKAFVSLTSNASTALKRNPKVSLNLLTLRLNVTHPPLLHLVIPVETVKLARECELVLKSYVSREKAVSKNCFASMLGTPCFLLARHQYNTRVRPERLCPYPLFSLRFGHARRLDRFLPPLACSWCPTFTEEDLGDSRRSHMPVHRWHQGRRRIACEDEFG